MEGSFMEIVDPLLPTQVDTQIDAVTTYESDSEEEEAPKTPPKQWAKLMSLSPDVPAYDLELTPPDEEGRQGVHRLGRSVNSCNLTFTQRRISNIHSILFCQASATDGKLIAYVEDNSANGTFVNRVKLEKGVRRILRNGDLLSLINPEINTAEKKDIEKTSFYIHLYLEDGAIKATKAPIMKAINDAVENNSSGLTKSDTVINLLSQKRNITDYYEIGPLLGSGANGQVFSGIHLTKGHEVAIKLTDMRHCHFTSGGGGGLTADGTGNSPADRVLKEAHMLRTLVHPQIIHLEDVFLTNTSLYMVMELVKGGDLFDRVVARGRYNEENACMVILQLVSAIAYMHERNIAHRDLKPENILLVSKDSDVNIKVTDFGLAKSTTENGGLKTYCGTPQYFAPEVLNQENAESTSTYSLPSDMWSVGVITFALLSGRLPWSDDERLRNNEILKAKYSFRGEPWDDISNEAKDFITKLIKKNPNDRLTAQQALYHPWFDNLSHIRDNYVNPKVNGSKTNKKSSPSSGLPAAPPQTKARKKGKRGIQETESSPQLESIVEETASDVGEVLPPARKITRRQSAMEIATTIDNSRPHPHSTTNTRPKRAASRK